MNERPEAWWRAPPEHVERVEENRRDFQEQFGDFAAAEAEGYWLGCSPDGQFFGLQFTRPDGSVLRMTIAAANMDQFFTELAGAMEYMGQRWLEHSEPRGVA
ncbi:hypothetical protein [Mesorhizobium sp. M7A.F.Ca.US.008.03.1.1]|uniref:hypothetical protein n=1 Tax=Mesorhizobium sp. M7A.F.Ca.US.008.03.1.1 TaxID=2496742 RepID=UPI000FCADFBF|nr:hypothetical protein [Mesorhizobium sp. M7A.F.Ca.US.008.03.1.1]RUW62124.1 hypothetical protein EOA16_10330 [Mesorhizobium sp. M7A.F.Ca.US.008.03.1.1]